MKTGIGIVIGYYLLIIGIVLAALSGEFLCIYKFCTSDFEPSYKREIVYGGSAILGIGCVVGYFGIKDEKTNTK